MIYIYISILLGYHIYIYSFHLCIDYFHVLRKPESTNRLYELKESKPLVLLAKITSKRTIDDCGIFHFKVFYIIVYIFLKY